MTGVVKIRLTIIYYPALESIYVLNILTFFHQGNIKNDFFSNCPRCKTKFGPD